MSLYWELLSYLFLSSLVSRHVCPRDLNMREEVSRDPSPSCQPFIPITRSCFLTSSSIISCQCFSFNLTCTLVLSQTSFLGQPEEIYGVYPASSGGQSLQDVGKRVGPQLSWPWYWWYGMPYLITDRIAHKGLQFQNDYFTAPLFCLLFNWYGVVRPLHCISAVNM